MMTFISSHVWAQKPNVIYILKDQWRSTALRYACNQTVKTPNLDKFSKEAVNFKNAVSVCSVCTPHRAVLFVSIRAFAITPFTEYRGIRTKQYTYVKTPDEATMLFDNIAGIKTGSVDSTHFITGIDLMPTLMEIIGLPLIPKLDGESFLSVLQNKTQKNRGYAYSTFYQIFAKKRYPIRCVQNQNYGYIYNFWDDHRTEIFISGY